MSPAFSAERPLVELKNVVKRFGDKTALDGLCLKVARGETVVVIGGSGSGKTTLARLLIGLDSPSQGHVLLDGSEIASLGDHALSTARRRFAMVFQKCALLDSLNVFDNVAFPLRELKVGEAEVHERVMAALEELDIDQAARRLPGELSGGMAKRVGIARAIVTEPEILVYDEPTSGLDPMAARVVDNLIDDMRERHLVTSIVITHDMLTAYEIADRVVLIASGKIVADAGPEAILASEDETIQAFVAASGVDLARLGPRKARSSPAEIRARWQDAHSEARGRERPWFWRRRRARSTA